MIMESTENEGKVKNIIRDTRKNVKYVILADRKLDRKEMLYEVRMHNFDPVNIRTKRDSTVTIQAKYAK